MAFGHRGRSLAFALAAAALMGGTAAIAHEHANRPATMLTDDGYRRPDPAPRKPRNREERRSDEAQARRRRKAERKTNASKAARRQRGKA